MLNATEIITGSGSITASAGWVHAPSWLAWTANCGIALAASVTILALIYAWGVIFRDNRTEAYVKQEIYELLVTGVLIGIIFSLVGAVTTLRVNTLLPDSMIPQASFDGTYVVHPDDNIYAVTEQYFERVANDMKGWLELNYYLNTMVDQLASVTPYAKPLGVGLVATPTAGFASPIKQMLYNMSSALSVAYIVNAAQKIVYLFALEAFLAYYLPIGIFLRCFTPTRRLGGTLIGVSLAFLFVFPVLNVISYSILYSPNAPMISFVSMVNNYMGSSNLVPSISDYFTGNFTGNFTDLLTGTIGGLGSFFSGLIGKIFLLAIILPTATVAFATAVAFLMPTVNLIVFTYAARGFSGAMGEEVDISSLTRLI